MKRKDLVDYLDSILENDKIKDGSLNGLQFEGKAEVKKIGLAVDASLESFELASERGCDLLLVHHGILWGFLQRVTGPTKKQFETLVKTNLNLYASHLPLDKHPDYGNNIELARIAGLSDLSGFGVYEGNTIGFEGSLKKELTNEELSENFAKEIGGKSLILPFGKEKNKRIGIVSGGGSSVIGEAISKGLDCLVTGEGPHYTHHLAKEGKLNIIYLGHYHSEVTGVKALGKHLQEKFGLEVEFLDLPTLV